MATVAEVLDWQACILRTTNNATATALANSGLTDDEILNVLLEDAENSTQPALLVYSLMIGVTQSEAGLDANAAFALTQFNAYAAAGVLNPDLGPYEAMGRSLSQEAAFLAQVAGQSPAEVITDFYVLASNGVFPNSAQINHFLAQYDYFVNLFTANGIPQLSAEQQALGAVVGQIIGAFGLQEDSSLDIRAENFLLGCIDGTSDFGGPLPSVVGNDFTLTIGVDDFSTSQAGAEFNAPAAGNPPLGTTNTLNTGDSLESTVGDATLNFVAVNDFLGNPSFAVGVTMAGIATANIQNLSLGLAGFAGDITGLTTVSISGNPFGDVQLGLSGLGLNTALETLNINTGDINLGGDVNIWIESSAFSGGEGLDINLDGVGSFVDLNVTGGANFYESVNISSLTSANNIELDTNAATIATITVDGDQDLEASGSALFMDTLELFDGSAATGALTAFFGGTGDVTVEGGSNDDHFTFGSGNGAVTVNGNDGDDTFTFLTNAFSGPTFGPEDLADGGAGDNTLQLQADEGTLLAVGVGASIINIQTIVHFEVPVGSTGLLTVDMSESGSANVLELNADYNGNGVTITELQNTDTVVYSGHDLGTFTNVFLTLEHASPLGIFNLVMAASDPLSGGTSDVGGTHTINDIQTNNGVLLNIDSIGDAVLNEILTADLLDLNIAITGDVDLVLGSQNFAYSFDDGIIDASTFEGDLTVFIGGGDQTVFAGLGDDLVILTSNDDDLIDLSAGGDDTALFQAVDGEGDVISVNNYTTVAGFEVGNDTIAIDVHFPNQINLQETDGDNVNAGDAVEIYSLIINLDDDLSGVDVNFIKFDAAISSVGLDLQETFDFYMDKTKIEVDGDADNILMAMYDTSTGSAIVFQANPDNTILEAGDDVDMIALVPMSQADFATFGLDGLEFVNNP
jgi:hypothetical protein